MIHSVEAFRFRNTSGIEIPGEHTHLKTCLFLTRRDMLLILFKQNLEMLLNNALKLVLKCS